MFPFLCVKKLIFCNKLHLPALAKKKKKMKMKMKFINFSFRVTSNMTNVNEDNSRDK